MLCFCLSFGSLLLSQADKSPVLAIRDVKLLTVTKGVIANGTILIRDGNIAAIGKDIPIPDGAHIISAEGLWAVPGFIDAFTNLGAADIGAENQDFDEATAPVTPHLRIIDAIDPSNKFIALARKTGITAALSAPGEGNLLSGQSALIHLAGRTVQDMLISFPVALNGSMGELPKLRYGQKGRYPSTRMGIAALLRQTFIDAQSYQQKLSLPEPPPRDFKLQALIPVLNKKMPLMLRANRRDDILTLLRIADEYQLKIILNHGAEAYRLADKLAVKKIPVIVGPVFSLQQREETSRAQLENAAVLHKAGVKIAFQTGSVRNVSDLIYQAQTAIKHGLPYQAALEGLTINPAEIYGVADRIGSLEKGKIANIVLFRGDPLDSYSKVVLVIIKGEIVESELSTEKNE